MLLPAASIVLLPQCALTDLPLACPGCVRPCRLDIWRLQLACMLEVTHRQATLLLP